MPIGGVRQVCGLSSRFPAAVGLADARSIAAFVIHPHSFHYVVLPAIGVINAGRIRYTVITLLRKLLHYGARLLYDRSAANKALISIQMPVKTDITEAEAFAAILRVIGRGEVPTQAVVQREVGRGSYPVIAGYLALWFERNGPGVASGAPVGGTPPALSLRAQLEELTRQATQQIDEAERQRIELLNAREATLDDRARRLDAREAEVLEAERRQLDRELAQVELVETLKADRDAALTARAEVAGQLSESQAALAAAQSTCAELRIEVEKAESALSHSQSTINDLREIAGKNNEARAQLEAECSRLRDERSKAEGRAEASRAGEASAQATVERMAAEARAMQESAQAAGERLNQAMARASAAEATAAELRAAATAAEGRTRDAIASAETMAESVASLRDSLAEERHSAAQLRADNEALRSAEAELRAERDRAVATVAAAIPLMERLEARLASDKQ